MQLDVVQVTSTCDAEENSDRCSDVSEGDYDVLVKAEQAGNDLSMISRLGYSPAV